MLIALFAACNEYSTTSVEPPAPPALPTVESAAVAANPHNVLSAIVAMRVRAADSVMVRVRRSGSAHDEATTPAVAVSGDSVRLPVLGLFADQPYLFTPVAFGAGGTTVGSALQFVTATLPTDLPRYTASGSDPLPGYVVFAANPYAIVIDNTGRVVWYRRFAGALGLNFMAQPNGHYIARPPTPIPDDAEPWVEIDVNGNVTRTLGCAFGLQPRLHDFIALPDGSYWILCDETRTIDLTELGIRDAKVIGTAVQHISVTGAPLFHWSVFDHFTITTAGLHDRIGSTVNWTHGNAIDLDDDGNLLVSFRNLGEITKINATNGSVMWRLGGAQNQFAFVDSPAPAFARQHSVRVDGHGVLLLDNVGNPSESRAEHYALDGATRTARLTGWISSTPRVLTQIGGSVQRVGPGRILVSFGTAGRVEEHDANAGLVWQIEGNLGYVFRAQRIQSLYAPGVDSPR